MMELGTDYSDYFKNNSFIALNYQYSILLALRIINIFDQFILISPFLKWEFGRTLEKPSRIPLWVAKESQYLLFLH